MHAKFFHSFGFRKILFASLLNAECLERSWLIPVANKCFFESPHYGESDKKQACPVYTLHSHRVKYFDLFFKILFLFASLKVFCLQFFFDFFSNTTSSIALIQCSFQRPQYKNAMEELEGPLSFFLKSFCRCFWKQQQSIIKPFLPLGNWSILLLTFVARLCEAQHRLSVWLSDPVTSTCLDLFFQTNHDLHLV